MRIPRLRVWLFTLLLAALPTVVQASPWFKEPFSADLVMISPDATQPNIVFKVNVGQPGNLRLSNTKGGKGEVVIISRQGVWTVFPAKKEYFDGVPRIYVSMVQPDMVSMPGEDDNPCTRDPKTKCKKEGEETLSGIFAEKWQLTSTLTEGKTYTSTIWSDPKRHIILKVQTTQGVLMTRTLLGKEKVAGRETEQWRIMQMHKDKAVTRNQWVDPTLGLVMRVDVDGATRVRMENVKVGGQNADLFQPPKDFKKVATPAPPKQTPDASSKQ
ncbi:MAG: hypothetical protein HQL82_14675 [Magnetococcales bacterium]|nr:hypothetical protein [Magnetococcales bacterium]